MSVTTAGIQSVIRVRPYSNQREVASVAYCKIDSMNKMGLAAEGCIIILILSTTSPR